MNRRKWLLALVCGAALAVGLLTLAYAGAVQAAVGHVLERTVLADAGGTMTSTHFRLDATLGQPSPIGVSAAAGHKLSAGYWPADDWRMRIFWPLLGRRYRR